VAWIERDIVKCCVRGGGASLILVTKQPAVFQ
jgi:hypothetical protein